MQKQLQEIDLTNIDLSFINHNDKDKPTEVLITCFEPFGDKNRNISEESLIKFIKTNFEYCENKDESNLKYNRLEDLLKDLKKDESGNYILKTDSRIYKTLSNFEGKNYDFSQINFRFEKLPVSYSESKAALQKIKDNGYHPDVILSFGEYDIEKYGDIKMEITSCDEVLDYSKETYKKITELMKIFEGDKITQKDGKYFIKQEDYGYLKKNIEQINAAYINEKNPNHPEFIFEVEKSDNGLYEIKTLVVGKNRFDEFKENECEYMYNIIYAFVFDEMKEFNIDGNLFSSSVCLNTFYNTNMFNEAGNPATNYFYHLSNATLETGKIQEEGREAAIANYAIAMETFVISSVAAERSKEIEDFCKKVSDYFQENFLIKEGNTGQDTTKQTQNGQKGRGGR